MTKKYDRKFGEIPEWATKGDITLENYDLRVEAHGMKVGWKDNWPLLSRIENIPGTANAGAWDLYFRDVLGGFPKTYQLYRDGIINALNLPEKHPGDFDRRFYNLKGVPEIGEATEVAVETWAEENLDKAEPLEYRQEVVKRIKNEMRGHGFKFKGDKEVAVETAESVRVRLGLSQEEWDAIPNAPNTWKQAGG